MQTKKALKQITKNIKRKIPELSKTHEDDRVAYLPALKDKAEKITNSEHFKSLWAQLFECDLADDMFSLLRDMLYDRRREFSNIDYGNIEQAIKQRRGQLQHSLLQLLLVMPTERLSPIERLLLLGKPQKFSEDLANLAGRICTHREYDFAHSLDDLFRVWLETLDVDGQLASLVTREMMRKDGEE